MARRKSTFDAFVDEFAKFTVEQQERALDLMNYEHRKAVRVAKDWDRKAAKAPSDAKKDTAAPPAPPIDVQSTIPAAISQQTLLDADAGPDNLSVARD